MASNQLLVRLITLTDNAGNFDFANLLDNMKNATDHGDVSVDRQQIESDNYHSDESVW